ncbi:Flagellar protein FlaG [hydrothermal vent metagenome]|uniref:Flagellar protein FlaG n=1 Tax=hydrothermal vent metagenome TaxID=652676 RepID=A0A3B0QVF0_9ZZZZ
MGDVGINSVVIKPVEQGVTAPEPKKVDVAKKEIKVEIPTLVGDDLEKSEELDYKEAVSTKEVEEVVYSTNDLLKRLNTELKVEVDKDSNMVVVKVIDGESKEVVRQIPAEEFIELSKRMEDAIGMLFDKKT